MRHIDSFCHFFPHALFEKMSQTTGGTRDIGKRMQGVRTIWDIDARLRMMDEFKDYTQVLSLGLPPIEGMVGPDKAPDFARAANDGLAELCAKHPDRFAGWVGGLPMNDPDAAVKEAERILIQRQSERPADSHQRQRPLSRRAAVLPDLRGRGQVGEAGAAASGPYRELSGFRRRDQIEIRDLGDPRLAL